ncbi:hypothetical protein F441_12134 [Phytophthora nicotianae CJ01A1]|uniref:Necrosis inducing protein NPP1 type n=1 Tax=Phytophthora nicotianae CJ01A1 TaxID=1317063 RepID=W2WQ94_PHYNI|nr:hypothetical protein F441_12134 [Phytophthora nicotianae CJ01A1]
MVLWLDNPALEAPKILGASLSQQLLESRRILGFKMASEKEPYKKMTEIPPMGFVGTQEIRQNRINFARQDGQYQDLIMWEQLTDEARAALDTADFGESKIPFNDKSLDTTLGLAWPFT